MERLRSNPVLVSHGLAVLLVLVVVIATGNTDNVGLLLAELVAVNAPAGVVARALVTPNRKLPREAPQ